jgi:hypothetical protein
MAVAYSVVGSFLLCLLLPSVTEARQQDAETPAAAELSCLPGLAHYFGFDEKEQGSYVDYVTGATATCAGCPSPAASLFAGGQRFNESSTGLDFSEIQNFQWGPHSSFTIEMWVQVAKTSATNQVLIGRVATDSRMIWWLGVNPEGYAVFEMRDKGRDGMQIGGSNVKLNDGKWHHVAVVRDGRLRLNKLYVDGYTIANFEYNYSDNFESISPVNIGYLNLDNGYHFNGTIDELMFYSRELTELEMRARYNKGAGSYCGPELVAPTITSDPVTYGVAGQEYRYDVKATGKPLPTFSLVSAPQGMTIDAATGALRWTPAAAGAFEVKVKATNSQGNAEQSFKIEVKKGTEEKVGLRHHWMLQETAGTRYKDYYTPYDAVAQDNTKPKPVKGAVGGGQLFDGVDDGLDVEASPNFNWRANESFTVELWMRTEASTAGNRVFIGRDAKDSPTHWWVGADHNGRAGFQLLDIGWQGLYVGNAGPQLNNGRWHQVVAVRDGASGMSKLFVDGEKVAEGYHVFDNGFDSRTPINIGYLTSGNGYHYKGELDEVKLFGRALTDAEIQERYMEVYDQLTEFLLFKGRYDGEVVILDWETINEIDCDNFEIERSEDQETFVAVGKVKGSGTTSSAIPYTFTDESPLKEQGYYRLRINRTNGTFAYSKTILVQHRSPIASSFKVYPNPTARQQEVDIEISNLKENEGVTFMVTDATGQRIHSEQVQTDAFGELRLSFAVGSHLRPGIYNLTVIGSNKTLSRKLVVAR